MSKEGVDGDRRRFLTLATSAVGAVGGAFAAVPFVKSWLPSEKAKALGASVTVDVSTVEPGEMKVVVWRRQPMWVIHRTKEMLDSLEQVTGSLNDPESKQPQQPEYIKGPARAIKPEFMVLRGVCTHLGCSPKFRPEDTKAADVGSDWKGGFFCPCHGSKFDLSGRVFNGVPAPVNLIVPPHRYADDKTLVIGEDPTEGEKPAEKA